MKNVKKLVLVALATVVVASSLVGCKKPEEKTTTPEVTAPVPVKIFANWSPAEQSAADKAWTQAIEKATNTQITYEIPPSANYNERLNVMLAGRKSDRSHVVL